MSFKTTAILTLLCSALAVSSAHAAPGFDPGNVARAYADGYYDNDRHWHRWRHHGDRDQFRSAHADMYHEWRHNDRHHHDEDEH